MKISHTKCWSILLSLAFAFSSIGSTYVIQTSQAQGSFVSDKYSIESLSKPTKVQSKNGDKMVYKIQWQLPSMVDNKETLVGWGEYSADGGSTWNFMQWFESFTVNGSDHSFPRGPSRPVFTIDPNKNGLDPGTASALWDYNITPALVGGENVVIRMYVEERNRPNNQGQFDWVYRSNAFTHEADISEADKRAEEEAKAKAEAEAKEIADQKAEDLRKKMEEEENDRMAEEKAEESRMMAEKEDAEKKELMKKRIRHEFKDIKESHQNDDAISYVFREKIVKGYSDGSYKAEGLVNRAEFAKIIMEAKFKDELANYTMSSECMPDVPRDAWFAKYICLAIEKGIIKGYPDGTFKPTNNVSFVEAAKMILLACGIDPGAGDPWFKPHIERMVEKKAVPTDIRKFTQEITRGQMAEIIYRMLDKVEDKPSMRYSDFRF